MLRQLSPISVSIRGKFVQGLGSRRRGSVGLVGSRGIVSRNLSSMASELPHRDRLESVLEFWYHFTPELKENGFTEETAKQLPRRWYGAGLNTPEEKSAFDDLVREQFEGDIERFAAGTYDSWAATPDGVSAICVLGDQLTRNAYRGQGKAFSLDAKVLDVVLPALEHGLDKDLHYVQRFGWYLPLMHSEDIAVHEKLKGLLEEQQEIQTEPWVKAMVANAIGFADKHRAMIEQFGRYPYRNKAIGRDSTPEEEAFLAGDVDTFGQ